MVYLIKSEILSLCEILKNKVFSIILIFIIDIYSIIKGKYYLLLIALLFILFVLYYNKKLFIILLIINILIIFITFLNKSFYYFNNYGSFENKVLVYQIIYKDDYNKVYVKDSHHKYFLNDKDKQLKVGEVVYIKGTIESFENSKSHMFNSFNYHDYLYYKNIVGKINIETIQIIKTKFIINSLHDGIIRYFIKHLNNPTLGIVSALTIGDKNYLLDDLESNFSTLGISHLFVISGLHIGLIANLLYFILKKFKLKDGIQNIIVLIILFFYYLITMCMVSVLRVIISIIINKILKSIFIILTNLDKLLLNASIVLLINPFYLFDYSYLLSYIVVLGIVLISKYLKNNDNKFKNYLVNSLFISLSSIIISLPIASNISHQINILQILFNLFYIPLVTYILLPISFILAFIPKLHIIFDIIMTGFFKLTNVCSKIDIFIINFPSINKIFYILYYIILYLILICKNKKILIFYLSIFIVYLVVWNNSFYFRRSSVYFFDLPSGDSTLLYDSKKNKTVLIDTGDNNEELLNNLLILGIKRIDLIIITHGDIDHIGGLNYINNRIKIKYIGINSKCNTSKKIISKMKIKNKKIIELKYNNTLNIGNIRIKIISKDKDYQNINNNSLVLDIDFYNYHFLFCGDIERKCELDLINDIKNNTYDFLKVAHHGSSTSSSYEFLSSINIGIGIAMNGYYNTFGFPSKNTINTFKNLNINLLNTKDYGSIKILLNIKNKRRTKLKYSFYS